MGIRPETQSALDQERSTPIAQAGQVGLVSSQTDLKDRSNRVRAICYEIMSLRKTLGGSDSLDTDAESSLLHLSKLNPEFDDQEITRLSAQAIAQALSALSKQIINASVIGGGILAVEFGGTGADLSATGGADQFVTQETVGGALVVGEKPDLGLKRETHIDLVSLATPLAF